MAAVLDRTLLPIGPSICTDRVESSAVLNLTWAACSCRRLDVGEGGAGESPIRAIDGSPVAAPPARPRDINGLYSSATRNAEKNASDVSVVSRL